MPKVKVDHTGMTAGHYYTKDMPVELPADVVEALGDSATPYKEEATAKKQVVQKKEVKKVVNRMVGKEDATTKADETMTDEQPAENSTQDDAASAAQSADQPTE